MKKFILFLIIFITYYCNLFSMEKKADLPTPFEDLQTPFKGDPVTIHGKTYDVLYLGSEPLVPEHRREEFEKFKKNFSAYLENELSNSGPFVKPSYSQQFFSTLKTHPIKFLGCAALVGISTYCLRNHLKTALLSMQKNVSNLNELFYRKIKTIFCNTKN